MHSSPIFIIPSILILSLTVHPSSFHTHYIPPSHPHPFPSPFSPLPIAPLRYTSLPHPRLINESIQSKPSLLKANVTHSRHLAMSSVQLLAPCGTGDVEVALAHTLDPNTLPSPAALKCQDPQSQVRGEEDVSRRAEVKLWEVRLG